MYYRPNLVIFESALQKCLKQWISKENDLGESLFQLGDPPIRTEREAELLCEALKKVQSRLPNELGLENLVSAPLNAFCSLFQNIATPSAYKIIEDRGIPLLANILDESLFGERSLPDGDLLFGLKILAGYHYHPAIKKISYAIRKRIAYDHYLWPVIFAIYSELKHPHTLQLISTLESRLPDGIAGASFLKLANEQFERGRLEVHPFSGLDGSDRLRRLISNTDPNSPHEAMQATLATAFMAPNLRDRLLLLASCHHDSGVRIEADRIAASFQNLEAIRRLTDWSLDPRFSRHACQALTSAGHPERIPKATHNDGFATLALLSNTLENSHRYGVIPDQLGIIDTRRSYWPPDGELINCWLCYFTCSTTDDLESVTESGVAFVTDKVSIHPNPSVANLPIDDLYAFYCAWHALGHEASREDIASMAAEGHQILAEATAI